MIVLDTIDVVCHSMGFAYSLGMIEELQKAKIKIGRYYIIAPENACSGTIPQNIEEAWQYGSDEVNHSISKQDGIAPQCGAIGIGTNRVYIPIEDPEIPVGFIDCHLTKNYTWIFKKIKNGKAGYVKRR